MKDSGRKIFALVGLAVLAGFLTIALTVACACVINTLPRSMPGEAVLAPWPVCLFGSFAASLVFPWVGSLLFLRDGSRRLYFLVCLVISNAVCHLSVGSVMLTEAYNRGL